MKRISKDEYYLGIAQAVSQRSTCLRRHYGCVIVKNDEIISTGYNGAPRGEENCCDRDKCYREGMEHNQGDYSECCSVHAEQNAMISASRNEMIGATLYIYGEDIIKHNFLHCHPIWGFEREEHREIKDAIPCPICSRMIKNAGIIRVVNRRESSCS